MYVKLDGREVQRRQAADLRAAALLRGAAARPRVHRGAGHHRADLRDLPGRLPDERGAGDGGRVRRRDRRRPAPRPAAADLLRRVDREPQPARLHAARPGLPRLPGRDRDGPRPPRRSSSRALQMKKAGNALMTMVGGREVHPINVRVGGFYRAPTRGELRALVRAARACARDRARDRRAGPRRWTSPTSVRARAASR